MVCFIHLLHQHLDECPAPTSTNIVDEQTNVALPSSPPGPVSFSSGILDHPGRTGCENSINVSFTRVLKKYVDNRLENIIGQKYLHILT